MRDKIRALVLSIEDYRDNDLMLKCLSKNEGFVTIISKSAKKISTSSHYYPGNIYEFIIDLKDNKTMYLSLGNKLIKNYYDINNLKLLAFKNVLFELCLKSKELYVPDLYTNLEILLQQISDENMYLLGTLFISFCLRMHGLSPQVDGCVVCQNKKVVGISQSLGGFVCENHLLSNKRLDAEVLKKFRLINKANFQNYDLIKDVEYKKDDFKIMMDFFIYNTELNIKTFDFYCRMF